MQFIYKIGRLLDVSIRVTVGAAMLAIVVIVTLQVFFRFVLNNALPWPEEASRFLMIWATFLAGAYALDAGEQTSIRLLVDSLPRAARTLVAGGAILASMAFLAVVAYAGLQEIKGLQNLTTGALGISRAIPYAAVPVSALLYCVVCVRKLYALTHIDRYYD